MRSKEEYLDSLKAKKPNVFMGGEVVKRDDEKLMPGVNVIGITFQLAEEEKDEALLTVSSHLSGRKINRFCHVHQGPQDLLKKQEMTRLYCQKVGGCVQRCMGIDSLNALSVITKDMDDAMGTEYHQRFLAFLTDFQERDLVGNCAQSDVKGDRSLRPHEQLDPDLYLRVVDKKKEGLVVRGAKAHNTIAAYADEIIVLPTRTLTKEEKAWAVAFAIPADWPGIKLVTRATSPRARTHLKAPGPYGMADSFTIFDDVVVPHERVFMNGEVEFAGRLALLFANFHRHSYCGCKPGMTDILLGASALVAEYNGLAKAGHIRDKIAELIAIGELVYAAGIAAATTGQMTSSGTCIPNPLYSNVGRFLAGTNIYHEYHTLIDIAGGLPATLPYEEDFYNPEVAPLLEKYMMRNPEVSSEEQHRCFRLISDLACSAYAGVMQVAGVHGGGSPMMEKIGIMSSYDLEAKKAIAKYLAGIGKS